MGSGEGRQSPVGDPEVRQGRAGGGTTYTWGTTTCGSGRGWGPGNPITSALKEHRHLPAPSLSQGKENPERVGRQASYSRAPEGSPRPASLQAPAEGKGVSWLGVGRALALTSWSSLLCSGAGYGEPGSAGGTWERLGLRAGPSGRIFTLLAGTMPCWPCREQRHQPSSPPAPSLCSTRRTSPLRKDSSWGDSAVLS